MHGFLKGWVMFNMDEFKGLHEDIQGGQYLYGEIMLVWRTISKQGKRATTLVKGVENVTSVGIHNVMKIYHWCTYYIYFYIYH